MQYWRSTKSRSSKRVGSTFASQTTPGVAEAIRSRLKMQWRMSNLWEFWMCVLQETLAPTPMLRLSTPLPLTTEVFYLSQPQIQRMPELIFRTLSWQLMSLRVCVSRLCIYCRRDDD